MDRVTVTMPAEMIRAIDRLGEDRAHFILEAVRRELERRRTVEWKRSLARPHPETAELVEVGFEEWAEDLPDEDVRRLVNPDAGTPVRWVPETGWVEDGR